MYYKKGNSMNVHVLGSAGWIPGDNETSCILVESNDTLFILDAGTGLSNLRNYKEILSKYDTIHILLSHYHLDHIIGLIYLHPYVHDKHLKIYGPGKIAYPETTSYYLHSLLRKEFFSEPIDNLSYDVQIIDFPSNIFFIGETEIRVKEQLHSSPSFQITLDNKLIYATDTIFDPNVWVGTTAELLFHECWDYTQSNTGMHTSLWQLKNQLPTDNFGKIILIHQNPIWSDNDYTNIKTIISGTNIVLANDGMELTTIYDKKSLGEKSVDNNNEEF